MPISIQPSLPGASVRNATKAAIGSRLTTEQWADRPLAIRERAFFSAQVENARIVSAMQNAVADGLSGEGGLPHLRMVLRDKLEALGYTPGEGKAGTIHDLTSKSRLDVMLKTNIEMAQGYAKWKAQQDPDYLDAYPCQELYRVEHRRVPRDWEAMWQQAGGTLYAGRMIATKDDDIWSEISRFETPWPPFDFNSGMGVRNVSRKVAEALGVIEAGEAVKPTEEDFNAKLEATVPDATPEALANMKSIFGDQIAVDTKTNTLRWDSDILAGFYREAATPGPLGENRKLDLGTATRGTAQTVMRDLGVDLTGWKLEADLNHVRHAVRKHGEKGLLDKNSGEKQENQVPLTEMDFRAAPLIWRHADKAVAGKVESAKGSKPPTGWPPVFRLQSDIAGQLWIGEFYLDAENKILGVGTAFRKK